MKKKSVILSLLFSVFASAQISLSYTYTGERGLTKLDYAGYMYYYINGATQSIDVVDVYNTLYKSIPVPNYAAANLSEPYLSDNLFDTDSLIEFLVVRNNAIEVYNELGTQVFSESGVSFNNWATGAFHMDIFNNNHLIFFDGISTQMKLYKTTSSTTGYYEVFDLPGKIPCVECSHSQGTATGIKSSKSLSSSQATFFPNPVKNELKLKYIIPPSAKTARIKVYDLNGKTIGDYRISSATDYILLPSDYSNGLYLYSLEIDGQVIKNEKIVLDKN